MPSTGKPSAEELRIALERLPENCTREEAEAVMAKWASSWMVYRVIEDLLAAMPPDFPSKFHSGGTLEPRTDYETGLSL